MKRAAWLLLLSGCIPKPVPVQPIPESTEARLVAFPYPPELFIHVIGEEDRRRVIVSGVECPDPDRAVRPLWAWIAAPVKVQWSADRLHGRVTLIRRRKTADAGDLLVSSGGCRPN